VETAADVELAAELLEALERKRGVDPGSLQIILLIESALGVWNARKIVTASPRIAQVALDEGDLCSELGVLPSEKHDPLIYARGRIAIEATAARVQPVGMAHPLGAVPRILPRQQLLELANRSRNLGFKGVICPHPSWVEPTNTAFTPTAEEVDYHTQVREVYAKGVAAGTAAVPFRGRMIDVPVAERAKDVLALAAACLARDEQKRRALERVTPGPSVRPGP
jgi:citrate lyase subunit beta/citryl-CoA lyase